MSEIIILGAGLTGLTTAYYLKKAGINCIVLEKENRCGGVIRTLTKDGFTFETGPNTGIISHPEVAELFEDLEKDCTLEPADKSSAIRYIWKGKQWEAMPSGPISAIKTPLYTWKDKFRILGEPFRKPGTNPHENLADMVKRRMGQSWLDYAIDPFILGVYAGDPEYIIPKYALPKLYNLEQDYGSFIGGAFKKGRIKKTEREKKATRGVFSVNGGLEGLIKALEKNLEGHIQLGCKNIRVEKQADKYVVKYKQNGIENEVQAPKLISSLGAHQFRETFPFLAKEDVSKIDNLQYARVAQISLGFKNWNGFPMKGFGGLVPFKENKDVLGVLFLSAFLKNRAPKDGALLSVFVGGTRKDEILQLDDSQLLHRVSPQIKAMMEMVDWNPDMIEVTRYAHAIPQYGLSSKERFEAIDKIQNENEGLTLAGNIRDGIGMADRIKQARELVSSLIPENINA